MNEVGANQIYRCNFDKAGGIHCFLFENAVPDGWKKRDFGYFPKRKLKANAELIQKIESLPTVSIFEWSDIFGADVFFQPGCFKLNETYFANGSNINGEDFVEIKMSEWALAKEAMSV